MVAVVAGASGLTGAYLLKELDNASQIDAVIALTRKPLAVQYKKVKELICDTDFDGVAEQIPKNTLFFCCLGTTIKRAGSAERFEFVDVTLVSQFIALAVLKEADAFVLQSSVGANNPRKNFYLQCKQRAENVLIASSIRRKFIIRPSLLLGKRTEFRLAEWIAQLTMPFVDWMFWGPLKRFRAVKAQCVAKAMLRVSLEEQSFLRIVESEQIQDLASGR
jgi:uncharacterized protein YbjT (DUF2867 family)